MRQEMNKHIHVYRNSRLQSENFTLQEVAEAYLSGLAALKEKAEAETPLTLEELKKMDGKPVWIVEYPKFGHWELSTYGEDYLENRDPEFYGILEWEDVPDQMKEKYGSVPISWMPQKLGWIAYRKDTEVGRDGPW